MASFWAYFGIFEGYFGQGAGARLPLESLERCRLVLDLTRVNQERKGGINWLESWGNAAKGPAMIVRSTCGVRALPKIPSKIAKFHLQIVENHPQFRSKILPPRRGSWTRRRRWGRGPVRVGPSPAPRTCVGSPAHQRSTAAAQHRPSETLFTRAVRVISPLPSLF